MARKGQRPLAEAPIGAEGWYQQPNRLASVEVPLEAEADIVLQQQATRRFYNMGWTSTHRDKGSSNRDWFASQFDGDNGRVLDAATVGGVCYIAYYCVPETGAPYTTALVCLTRWSPKDQFNFSYKDISEDMGPVYYACPQRILDQLSPLEDMLLSDTGAEWASSWRQACQDYQAQRQARGSVSCGQRIRFSEPMRFSDGCEADTFEWIKGNTFQRMMIRPDGSMHPGSQVRIRGWRDRSWSRI